MEHGSDRIIVATGDSKQLKPVENTKNNQIFVWKNLNLIFN